MCSIHLQGQKKKNQKSKENRINSLALLQLRSDLNLHVEKFVSQMSNGIFIYDP
jgi:hypothetical protein